MKPPLREGGSAQRKVRLGGVDESDFAKPQAAREMEKYVTYTMKSSAMQSSPSLVRDASSIMTEVDENNNSIRKSPKRKLSSFQTSPTGFSRQESALSRVSSA